MKPYRFTTVPTSLWWLRGSWVAMWWCGVDEFDGSTTIAPEAAHETVFRGVDESVTRFLVGEMRDGRLAFS